MLRKFSLEVNLLCYLLLQCHVCVCKEFLFLVTNFCPIWSQRTFIGITLRWATLFLKICFLPIVSMTLPIVRHKALPGWRRRRELKRSNKQFFFIKLFVPCGSEAWSESFMFCRVWIKLWNFLLQGNIMHV